jgi:hypothetical protein
VGVATVVGTEETEKSLLRRENGELKVEDKPEGIELQTESALKVEDKRASREM